VINSAFYNNLTQYKMGCKPSSDNKVGIIEVKPGTMNSNRSTGDSVNNDKNVPNLLKQISANLFIICEEGSKYEESNIPSNGGIILTPQQTEHYKDS